jgi:hypothetical protein
MSEIEVLLEKQFGINSDDINIGISDELLSILSRLIVNRRLVLRSEDDLYSIFLEKIKQ